MVLTRVQYESGVIEVVDLPATYPAGTLLSVVKRNGQLPVVTLASTTKACSMCIQSAVTGWAVGDTVMCRVQINYDLSLSGAFIRLGLVAVGTDTIYTEKWYEPSDHMSSGYIETPNLVILSGTSSVLLQIENMNGFYATYGSAEWTKDAGSTWSFVTDGDFSAGEFSSESPNQGWYIQSAGYGVEFVMVSGAMVSRNVSRYA